MPGSVAAKQQEKGFLPQLQSLGVGGKLSFWKKFFEFFENFLELFLKISLSFSDS